MRYILYILLSATLSGCIFSTSSDKPQNRRGKKKLVLPRKGDKPPVQNKLNRTVSFSYDGNNYQLNLSFDNSLYDYYKSQPKMLSNEIYATEFSGHTYIKRVADKLKAIASQNGLDNQGLVELSMAFIQGGFPYTNDPDNNGYDYPKFPIELFVEGGGDCEDKAAALAALLTYFSFDVVLVRLPGHIAVAIDCENCDGGYYQFEGKQYAFIESTNTGWQIAVVPPEYQSTDATLLHVPASPYNYTSNETAYYK